MAPTWSRSAVQRHDASPYRDTEACSYLFYHGKPFLFCLLPLRLRVPQFFYVLADPSLA
jgi:hypothetical protein